MGRPERRIESDNAVLGEFATGLRALRRQAGSPSYRMMAAKCFYSAASLSEAAAGRRLPTLDATMAYVAACGGDEDEWRQRWQTVADAIGPHQPSVTGLTDQVRTGPDSQPPVFDRPSTRALVKRLIFVVPALVVLVVFGAWLIARSLGRPIQVPASVTGTPVSAGPSAPTISDHLDPKVAGCTDDAVDLQAVLVMDDSGYRYGTVELRYSPHCRAAWVRYTPTTPVAKPTTASIVITRDKPADRAHFTSSITDGAIYSDLLLFAGGCLEGSVTVNPATRPAVTAHTTCLRDPKGSSR